MALAFIMKLKYLKYVPVLCSIVYSAFISQELFASKDDAKTEDELKIESFIFEVNKFKESKDSDSARKKIPQEIVNFATKYVRENSIPLKLIDFHKEKIQNETGLKIESVHDKENKTRTVHFKYTGVYTSNPNTDHYLQRYDVNASSTNFKTLEDSIIKNVEMLLAKSEQRILTEIQKRHELNREFLSKIPLNDSNSIKPSDLTGIGKVVDAVKQESSDISSSDNASKGLDTQQYVEKFAKMYPLYYGILMNKYTLDEIKEFNLDQLKEHAYLKDYWADYINANTFKRERTTLNDNEIKLAVGYLKEQANDQKMKGNLELVLLEKSPRKTCMLTESGLKQTLNKIYELTEFKKTNEGNTKSKIAAYNDMIAKEGLTSKEINRVDPEKLKRANEKRNKAVRERNKKLEVVKSNTLEKTKEVANVEHVNNIPPPPQAPAIDESISNKNKETANKQQITGARSFLEKTKEVANVEHVNNIPPPPQAPAIDKSTLNKNGKTAIGHQSSGARSFLDDIKARGKIGG